MRKLYQIGAFLRTLAEEILSKNHIILFWKPFTLKTFFFFLFHKLRSDVNFRRKNVVRVWLFSTVYLNLFFYKSDFQQHTYRYKKAIYSKSLNKRFGSGFLFIVWIHTTWNIQEIGISKGIIFFHLPARNKPRKEKERKETRINTELK